MEALSIVAFCTHPVLSNGAIKNIKNSYIQKLLVSNSINRNILHSDLLVNLDISKVLCNFLKSNNLVG